MMMKILVAAIQRSSQNQMKRSFIFAKRLGFQELGPNQTSIDLFGNYRAGDNVAIITRLKDDEYANSLADKLRGGRFDYQIDRWKLGRAGILLLVKANNKL